MRINPGLTVTVSTIRLQIGTGARSVLLEDPGEEQVRFIQRLQAGLPDGDETSAAQQCGMSAAQTTALLEHLLPVLVSLPAAQIRRLGAPTQPGPMTDEVRVSQASLVGTASDPEADLVTARTSRELMGYRQAAAVQILGLGRTGAGIARVLAFAGIGQLLLWDTETVMTSDVGPSHNGGDVGRVRSVAVARRLQTLCPSVSVFPNARPQRPDLAGEVSLVVTRGWTPYDVLLEARAADHPVLPVVLRDDDALIGPWSLSGVSPCPLCVTGLAATGQKPNTGGAESVSVATAVAGLAGQAVINRVDAARDHDVAGVMLRVDAATAAVQTLQVPPAEGCVCVRHIDRQQTPPSAQMVASS